VLQANLYWPHAHNVICDARFGILIRQYNDFKIWQLRSEERRTFSRHHVLSKNLISQETLQSSTGRAVRHFQIGCTSIHDFLA
jgi:hypothetical protein